MIFGAFFLFFSPAASLCIRKQVYIGSLIDDIGLNYTPIVPLLESNSSYIAMDIFIMKWYSIFCMYISRFVSMCTMYV